MIRVAFLSQQLMFDEQLRFTNWRTSLSQISFSERYDDVTSRINVTLERKHEDELWSDLGQLDTCDVLSWKCYLFGRTTCYAGCLSVLFKPVSLEIREHRGTGRNNTVEYCKRIFRYVKHFSLFAVKLFLLPQCHQQRNIQRRSFGKGGMLV